MLVSPELADVLSAIVTRIRRPDGEHLAWNKIRALGSPP
jgi:hypothetical protein